MLSAHPRPASVHLCAQTLTHMLTCTHTFMCALPGLHGCPHLGEELWVAGLFPIVPAKMGSALLQAPHSHPLRLETP